MPGEPPLNPYEAPREVDQPPPAALNQPQILGALFGGVFSILRLALVLGAAYLVFKLYPAFWDIAPND